MLSYSPSSPELTIRRRLALVEAQRRGLSEQRAAANKAVPAPPFPAFGPAWLQPTAPAEWVWTWPWQLRVQAILGRITAGECRRSMLTVPIRHGKTELVTVRYAVYRLERDPATRIIVGAHGQDLANELSRKIRRIALARGVELATDSRRMDDWQTVAGGGVRAVGVGGSVVGRGANLILIDDPVKSREEAESEAYRHRVWEWYRDDLWTRQEPGAAINLTMSRYHEDDLAGRLLQAAEGDGDQWETIHLPALAEVNDPLGRQPGEALCPERFDEEALAQAQNVLGRSFQALYQGRPQAHGGDFFRVLQFAYCEAEEVPSGLRAVRAWDQAATSAGGDYSAGVKMGGPGPDGRFYVLDVRRGQWGTDDRDRQIRTTAESDGGGVRVRGAQDPGSAGVDAAKAFTRLLAGFSVTTERASGPKETRADPYSSQVNAGNVVLVRGPWNSSYRDELAHFPYGKHDDQVDASADAFAELAAVSHGRGREVARTNAAKGMRW